MPSLPLKGFLKPSKKEQTVYEEDIQKLFLN